MSGSACAKSALAAAYLVAAVTAQAGPISKFTEKPPKWKYVSSAKIYDAERCMVDMDGWLIPIAVRQPDRTDRVTLIWTIPNGIAAARVDLAEEAGGLSVTAWHTADQVRSCAPPLPVQP